MKLSFAAEVLFPSKTRKKEPPASEEVSRWFFLVIEQFPDREFLSKSESDRTTEREDDSLKQRRRGELERFSANSGFVGTDFPTGCHPVFCILPKQDASATLAAMGAGKHPLSLAIRAVAS